MALSAFQRRVLLTCRRARAVLILGNALDSAARREVDGDIERIPLLTKKPLAELESHYDTVLRNLDGLLGFVAAPDEYVALVDEAAAMPDQLVFMTKRFIEKHLFKNYGALMARWPLLPPHTRFGIDTRGGVAYTGQTFEWRLLEAALFEDVAMLWNDCVGAEADDSHALGDAKIPGKRYRCLRRSAARAVFALLEGYVNGIAVNVLASVDLSSIDAKDRELLQERSDDGRARFKRFREKVLQYPKLALGAAHPPIQDANPHLQLVLSRERDWRDAIVHPTPRLEEDRALPREKSFFEIELAELRELVDAAIGLVRDIDAVLGNRFGSVDVWLTDRAEDDRFPSSVFH